MIHPDPASGRLAALAGTFTAIIYLVAFLTPQPMPVVGAVVGLSLFGGLWTAQRTRPALPAGVALALGLGIAWGLVTAVWTIDVEVTLKKSGQLIGTAVMAVVLLAAANALPECARQTMRRVALWGGGLLIAATAIEGYAGLPWHTLAAELGWRDDAKPHVMNRTTLIMVLLSWPAALAAVRLGRRKLAPFPVIAAAVVPLGLDSGTAILAAAGGLAAGGAAIALAVVARGALVRIVAAASVVLGALSLPLAANAHAWAMAFGPDSLPRSLLHRFHIWEFAVRHGLERVLHGWGLGVSRVMPNFGETPLYSAPGADIIPLHTHNTYVQVFMETGAVGVTLLLGLTGWVILATRHWRTSDQVCTVGLVSVIAASWLTGYGAWQSWWIASLAVLAFLTVALRDHGAADARR